MLNKLQKFRQDLKKKGKGFTLVELIVVIIIIAIIAAVAIPAITGFQDNARKSRIQSEHRELVSAVQSYIGSQAEPEKAKIESLDQLAPYMSKGSNGKSKLADTLGSNTVNNTTTVAHKIENGELVSEFIPTGGSNQSDNYQKWAYNWKSQSEKSTNQP